MSTKTSSEYNHNNKTLAMFVVIAAFGLVMATVVVVLPIVPQAHALSQKVPPACDKPGLDLKNKNCPQVW